MPYCYPPDPNTRKPKFTPPPNACDTHFHVFGPPEVFRSCQPMSTRRRRRHWSIIKKCSG